MKLIICNEFVPMNQRRKIAEMIEGVYEERGMDGDPFEVLKKKITSSNNAEDEIFVTSDERFLLFVPKIFKIEDVYIYQDEKIKNIQSCTKRILRMGHNFLKLYLSGEFEKK